MNNNYQDEEVPLAERVVEVPIDSLKPDVLKSVIEEFVTREGTDYGEDTFELSKKVTSVLNQLKAGEAKIFYDNTTESIDIISGNAMKKLIQRLEYEQHT